MKVYHASINLMGGDTRGFLIDSRSMVNSIIADSGVWSVSKGKSNALISYLRKWGHLFDLFFNFDTNFNN